MVPVPIENKPECGHWPAPAEVLWEIAAPWWMDHPWSRAALEWNRTLWEAAPIARLIPLDLAEVANAFLRVGQGLAANPRLAGERSAEWVSGLTAIGCAAVTRGWSGEAQEVVTPDPKDRRFRSPEWSLDVYFWGIKETSPFKVDGWRLNVTT